MLKLAQGVQLHGLTGWNLSGQAFRTIKTGPSSQHYPIGQGASGNFQAGQAGYIGFRVKEAFQHYYYGWLRIQFGKDGNGRPLSISLVADGNGDYGAYNATLNGGITVGQEAAIPEPASTAAGLALFALGAVGLREFRRRRKAA